MTSPPDAVLLDDEAALADMERAAASIGSYDNISISEVGAVISQYIAEAQAIEIKIAEHDAATTALKRQLKTIMEERLPLLLDRIGLPEIGIDVEGRRVRIALDFNVFGSISKCPDFGKAVAHLRETGFGGKVITTISLDFTEDQDDEKNKVLEAISAEGAEPNITADVNSATLRAHVRQCLMDGAPIDLAAIGCTVVRAAKFSKK
jgi:hypothetical protein